MSQIQFALQSRDIKTKLSRQSESDKTASKYLEDFAASHALLFSFIGCIKDAKRYYWLQFIFLLLTLNL